MNIELYDEKTEKENYLADLSFEKQQEQDERDALTRMYFEQSGKEWPMID